MANSVERTGPGQSGAAAGQSYFNERIPGANAYPVDSMPQGSRSTFDDESLVEPALSDERVREMVVAALRDDASGIEITVARGTVTLVGHVAGDDEKQRIDDLVRRVSGVEAVDNQLGART
jgi:osmotically-inducible protein OsmY